MKDFQRLSKRDAETYLEQFVAESAQLLTALRERSAASGGPPESALDFSPVSLVALWSWVLPQLRWRDGFQPSAPGQPPARRFTLEEIQPVDALPSWFEFPGRGYENFDPDTLWLIDAVSRYLAESLLRSVPQARWTVGRSKVKSYVDQNLPVLTGFPDPVNPVRLVNVAAVQALQDPANRSAERLKELHDLRVASVTG